MKLFDFNTRIRIRKIIVYTIYIVMLSSFQVSFPDKIGFLGQTADLMLVFVVLAGYFYGFWDGAIVGFCSGLLRDVFSPPAVVGLDGEVRVTAFIGVLTLFMAGITGASFFTRRMHRNIPFSVVSVIFVTVCYKVAGYILIYGWSSLAGLESSLYTPLTAFIYSFLPQLLLNTLAAIPIILLLRFLGPVPFKYAKDRDDIVEKQGENSWLGI